MKDQPDYVANAYNADDEDIVEAFRRFVALARKQCGTLIAFDGMEFDLDVACDELDRRFRTLRRMVSK